MKDVAKPQVDWGGARPGSGRKPLGINRKPYSFRLSPQEHKQVKSFIAKLKEENNMATSYKVIYSGGESRTSPGQAVDYMLATINGIELYAELPALDDEEGNFDALKQNIIDQAKLQGINPDTILFEQ